MHYDKKRLLCGIFLLFLAALSVFGILTTGFRSYYATVILLGTVLGIGFIRQSKYR